MTLAITLAVLQTFGFWAALRLVRQPRSALTPPCVPTEFLTGEWREAPIVLLGDES